MATISDSLNISKTAETEQQASFLADWTFCRPEIVQHYFTQFLSELNTKDINALACVNGPCNKVVTALWNRVDLLKKVPLTGLTIIDAQMLGCPIDDEPLMDNRKIVHLFKSLAPLVKGDDGLTLLTMPKGLTLNQIIEIANASAIGVIFPIHITQVGRHSPVLDEMGEVRLEQSERLLISNNVLDKTPGKGCIEHEALMSEIGCKMPTVQQNIFHCVCMFKFFEKCIYGEFAGRTSSKINSSSLNLVVRLVVEQHNKTQIIVTTPYFNYEDRGAGACINFQ